MSKIRKGNVYLSYNFFHTQLLPVQGGMEQGQPFMVDTNSESEQGKIGKSTPHSCLYVSSPPLGDAVLTLPILVLENEPVKNARFSYIHDYMRRRGAIRT